MTKLSKYLDIFLYVLLAITLVFAGLFYFGGEVENAAMQTPLYTESFINWGTLLLFVAGGITLLFEILNLVLHPQNAIRSIISIVLLGIIVFIAYGLGDGTPLNLVGYKGADNVPSMLLLGDTFLYSIYILFGIALFAILYIEVSRIFK